MDPNCRSETEDDSAAMPEETRQNNPSLPIEMKDYASKMRGDAIGNTLYSECWVIKLLMKLAKFCPEDWTDDLETDLCLLWDMTMEPDVVKLMMSHSFLELSFQIIRDSPVPRLTEILVGIMGNLSCVPSVREEIAQRVNVIRMLLDLLSLPDVPTLLQLMRLLQTCFWDLRNSEASPTPFEIAKGSESKTKDISKEVVSVEHVDENTPVTNTNEIEISDSTVNERCIENNSDDRLKLQFLGEQSNLDCSMDVECSDSDICSNDCSRQNESESYCSRQNESECDVENSELKSDKDSKESLWLQELNDVNKWLPCIYFILRSSVNVELLRNTFALLDTLSYVPSHNDILGRHFADPGILSALMEALDQLYEEYKTDDDDLCPSMELEKSVCHWASILSAFTLFADGRMALKQHAEKISDNLCRHLLMYNLTDQLGKRQAESITLTVTVMRSFLDSPSYFHPPIFSYFLSTLTKIKGKSAAKEEHGKDKEVDVNEFATREVQQEVIDSLEIYFQDVVRSADGKALAAVLQHCSKQDIAILQFVMEDRDIPCKS